MKLILEANEKVINERILAILELGLLTALSNNVISIEECEGYLFNPYIMKLLNKNKINTEIINIIHEGCELEDIQSLLPDKLTENIERLNKKCLKILEILEKPEFPIDKLIEKSK
ncbi:Protein of unknown function [Clostridium cavendishii DSM 21758]|uniref:DUF3969 domain-containing protein n=1 Tax=Clostridium cavendishii DSM 21758 TaxID=1121302 RepID=A0A1M6AIY8_9CLOT|nr:DUF3969 family protein [Clostridium cavendishii]SHI36445.1 Protein of unknown function [Clostridium cavendishii DSM 21758]